MNPCGGYLFAAEANQAAANAALRKNLVAIYTAAGGGWQSGSISTP